MRGIPHQTERDVHRIWAEHNVEPEDYDEPVDEFWWETRFDLETGPTAKAYHLLKKIDLGPTLNDQPTSRIWCSARVTLPTKTADGSTQGTT